MSGPGVEPLGDFAGVPDLLDDVVALPLDDSLEVGHLVPGLDHEAPRIGADLLVLLHGELHQLDAIGIAAFAEETGVRRLEHRLGDLLDPLVHLAEEALVPGHLLRTRVHAVEVCPITVRTKTARSRRSLTRISPAR